MKKTLCLFICILLAGCGPYSPQLTEAPKNMSKYESDKAYCIEVGRARKNKSDIFDADAWKTPVFMANECMSGKGYKLVNEFLYKNATSQPPPSPSH